MPAGWRAAVTRQHVNHMLTNENRGAGSQPARSLRGPRRPAHNLQYARIEAMRGVHLRWRHHPLPWLSAALFMVNAAVAWPLFRVEYLAQTGTVEGLIVSYARYARDHWPDWGWCRFWFDGVPFQNAYVPAAPLAAAALSYFGHLSAARAFHIVVAFMYCLGPVTLFWMTHRLTRSAGWSFCAGLICSLVSPSALLVPEIRRDLGSLFWDRRLHTMAVYGDNPHVASLALVPLAILALDVALERRRPVYYVAAALALAAVPLTNWPGAIVLACAVGAYGLCMPIPSRDPVPSRDRKGAVPGRLGTWARTAGVGALAYAMVIPWLPPSAIITTQSAVQGFDPAYRFNPHHLAYLAILAVCTWVLLRLLSAARAPGYLRFFLLFFFGMAAVTLGHYWFGLTLLAQPWRFHLAMEMGFTLSLVFTVRHLLQCRAATFAEWLRRPIAVAFAILCTFQFVQYGSYARRLIRGIDITQTSEYKTARWFGGHMPDSRVMVPGSTTFWLNAFTDTPQLEGCCLQSLPAQTIPIAIYGIDTDLTAENRAVESSLLWFKALGVRAVAVSGPRSTEVYKPFRHPQKFAGRWPVLWRDGDDVIYEVPWRDYSIAHAIEPGDVVARTPVHGVDTDPLIPYVAAIDRPDAPALQVRWPDNETIAITGNLRTGQIVSVQESWNAGWHAAVNGLPRRVFADKLGLMAVIPECAANCVIELRYDGGAEMRLARWISGAAITGSLVWILLGWGKRGW